MPGVLRSVFSLSILEYYLNKIFKFYNFYLVPSTILASKSLPSSSDASAILNACSRDPALFCFSQEHLVKFGDHVQSQQCMLSFVSYSAIY